MELYEYVKATLRKWKKDLTDDERNHIVMSVMEDTKLWLYVENEIFNKMKGILDANKNKG